LNSSSNCINCALGAPRCASRSVPAFVRASSKTFHLSPSAFLRMKSRKLFGSFPRLSFSGAYYLYGTNVFVTFLTFHNISLSGMVCLGLHEMEISRIRILPLPPESIHSLYSKKSLTYVWSWMTRANFLPDGSKQLLSHILSKL
jgi:hypothetical protein